MSRISDRLYATIKGKGLSYGELSSITKIPKSALQRYATGETEKIPLDRIEVLAIALDVTPEYLMGWTDSEGGKNKRELLSLLLEDSEKVELLEESQHLSKENLRFAIDFIKKLQDGEFNR